MQQSEGLKKLLYPITTMLSFSHYTVAPPLFSGVFTSSQMKMELQIWKLQNQMGGPVLPSTSCVMWDKSLPLSDL